MNVQTDAWPRPHRLTVTDYYRMAEVGVLAPDARVELFEGEIIDMPPIGDRHGAAVIHLTKKLVMAVGDLAFVSVQGAVRFDSYTELQPDFAVLRLRADDYRNGHPTAADVLLLMEVSDTTLRFDRGRKAALYARHAVPELWVVDVNAERLHVMRNPSPSGYAEQTTVATGVMPIPGLPVLVDLSQLF